MSERLPVLYQKKPCYDIVFSRSFDELWQELAAVGCENRRLCIITDAKVDEIYGEEVLRLLRAESQEGGAGKCLKAVKYVFPAGEESKTLDTVRGIYRFLIEEGFDRKDMLLALGGGVVGDITGYAAATYLRGIDFVQIPTTLLAQADSSIGGKTGVDFDGYKNMVGAFKMPRLYGICERDLEVLQEMMIRSCTVKKLVVEKDPLEQGERALLNFGHTVGHAIATAKNFELYHGECVALGAVAAAYISWKRELLSMEEYYEIRDMFVPFYLPISVEGIDPEEILKLTKSDKKMESGKIKFVLLKKIGKAFLDQTVTDEEILAAVNEIYYSEEDAHA